MFLCARNLFVKNINRLEIVLITSFYYTTETAKVADIQQAFLQIWFKDISNSDVVKALRFVRAVFGLTCIPFLMNATIRAPVV